MSISSSRLPRHSFFRSSGTFGQSLSAFLFDLFSFISQSAGSLATEPLWNTLSHVAFSSCSDRQGPSVNVDVMLTGADVEVSRFGSLGSHSQRHERDDSRQSLTHLYGPL